MSITVPEKIFVGENTCYCHFARGELDLYAPSTMLPDPPAAHTWAYSVSREHNDTVYFYNAASGRSLWVLPPLSAGETGETGEAGEAEAEMRAVGAVESAARRRRSRRGGAAADRAARQSGARVVQRAAGRDGQTDGAAAAAAAGDGGSVRDRLATWRARRAQQQSQAQEGIRDAVGEQSAVRPARSQSLANSVESAHAPVGQRLPKEEAPHQQQEQKQGQKQGQEAQSVLGGDVLDEKRRLFLLANEELQREKEEALRRERNAIEHSRRCREAEQREDEARARLAVERRKLEERRVELQRRAIERQEAAIAAAEAEALRRETVEQVNKYYEKARELDQQAETEQQKAVSFECAIAKSLLDSVAGFQSNVNQSHSSSHNKHSALGQQGNDTGASTLEQPRCIDLRIIEDSSSVSSTASSRGGSVSGENARRKAHTSFTAARSRREQHSHAPHGTAHNTSASAGTLCERTSREGRIQYSPALMYIGGVTGLSGDKFIGGTSGPLLQRQGHGKLFYDAAQKSFFEGEWVDDKRSGRGTLSLPHVAVEGEWRDDMLEGRATFQTRRLKGTGEFAKGAPSGNAIVELDCNSVFAGSLGKNGEVDSGAITLGSGDHVEWIEEAVAKPSGQRNESQQTVFEKRTDHSVTATRKSFGKRNNAPRESERRTNGGTGKSRIQFANGDVYVGEVLNYLPHGKGSYRFAEEGNEYMGEFSKGHIHGSGTYRFADGNVYVGQMYKGLFHGEGQYVQKDTYTYEGSWEYGTAHGKGKITFANGDVWEGTFEHDKRMDGRYIESKLFQL